MATPTVRRLQLGNELRRLREAAGTTPAEAARVLGCNVTKISRIELGQSGIAIGDVKMLLESYGDDDPEHVQRMMELARGNRERGRWAGHRSALPEWFRIYVDLERDAEDIRLTGSEVVPGLLQSEAYIRALFEPAVPYGGLVDIEGAVAARQERQELLHRADPPTLSCVISESCVRRVVGGREVMADQLEHLVEVAGFPRVQLQLRPFEGEATTIGAGDRFTMLRIPVPGDGPPLSFVYCEDFDGARYVDDKAPLRAYESLWGALQAAALGPAETRSRLRQIAKQYREGPPDDPRASGLHRS